MVLPVCTGHAAGVCCGIGHLTGMPLRMVLALQVQLQGRRSLSANQRHMRPCLGNVAQLQLLPALYLSCRSAGSNRCSASWVCFPASLCCVKAGSVSAPAFAPSFFCCCCCCC
jgi:hypothetical protein